MCPGPTCPAPPGPAPPARSLLHFQIPQEGDDGDTGGLQELAPQRGWVHLLQPYPPPGSGHHPYSSSVMPPAPTWAGRRIPNHRLPLPPAAAIGLGIVWGDSPQAQGQVMTSMCWGRSCMGRKPTAPSTTGLPWSTASQTANKHQILPLFPPKPAPRFEVHESDISLNTELFINL